MRAIHKAVAGLNIAALLLVTSPAHAENFQFSYRFNTGELITGSFAGTLNGDLVGNISQLQVSLNGSSFTGELSAFSYTSPGNRCPSCFAPNNAVASFDPLKNNFVFSNGDFVTGSGVTNLFYVIPWSNGANNPVATQAAMNGVTINVFNGQYVPQNWTLTAVPEPASLSMLLLGLAVLAARKRRAA